MKFTFSIVCAFSFYLILLNVGTLGQTPPFNGTCPDISVRDVSNLTAAMVNITNIILNKPIDN